MKRRLTRWRWWLVAGIMIAGGVVFLLFGHGIATGLMTAYHWFTDRDQITRVVGTFGCIGGDRDGRLAEHSIPGTDLWLDGKTQWKNHG